MRLLIADDESVIRKGLLSLDWTSIGIEEVLSASNGAEAKRILLSQPVDIGIFDIRMPGMTGIELAQMHKKYSLDMAIVILSGFSEFEYAREAIRSGVYEYLLKPVSPREILQTIAEVKNRLEQERYQKQLVREHERSEGTFDTVTQVRNRFPRVSKVVMEMLTDMAQEFAEPITLNELSEKYYFTTSYVSKKIKQETGYSFVNILNAIRLMNAAKLLQEGERINIVCEKSGFRDQRYFSQVFKKAFGCSLSEYKKADQKLSDIRFPVILENAAGGQVGLSL